MPKSADLLTISPEQRRTLEAWVRAQNTPQSVAFRARIALLAADGVPNSRIAREVGVSRPTVMLWRQRFLQGGPSALTEIASGRGRRVTYGADRVNEVVQATTQTKPPGATHWSTRTMAMAKAQGLSKATVQRIWSAHGVTAPPDEAIQALQGLAVHRETHRRSGAVPQSSRQSRGPVRG